MNNNSIYIPKLLKDYNQVILNQYLKCGAVSMGPYASYTYKRDPKQMEIPFPDTYRKINVYRNSLEG